MNEVILAQKKTLELKKHVGLIHSTNRLSLLERKIANALLYNAYENLLAKNEHQIHIPSLCILIGFNSKDHKTIKKALISLISTVLEWNIIDKEKEDDGIWMASAMLSDAKIEGPICTYSYSNRMRELCYYPEFYGRLNMQVLSMFKSTYGLALYENCIRYQNISQTPWLDLLTYRKLMGVSPEKYTVFRDFNNRVINPAVKEVNTYAPIFIKPEFKKQGRAVSAIRFIIAKQNSHDQVEKDEKSRAGQFIESKLQNDYGLSDSKIKFVLQKYGKSYILEKMKLIEASISYKNGTIKNLAKYLEKALVENYQPPKSSKDNLEKLRRQNDEAKKIAHQKEKYMDKYRVYLASQLPEIYKNVLVKEKEAIEKAFDKAIKSTVYHNVFMKDGLDNPLIRDRFADFIKTKYPELLSNVLSFEKFYERENDDS